MHYIDESRELRLDACASSRLHAGQLEGPRPGRSWTIERAKARLKRAWGDRTVLVLEDSLTPESRWETHAWVNGPTPTREPDEAVAKDIVRWGDPHGGHLFLIYWSVEAQGPEGITRQLAEIGWNRHAQAFWY